MGYQSKMEGTGDGQCARLALSMWSLGVMTQISLRLLDMGWEVEWGEESRLNPESVGTGICLSDP